ncbi:hypothetical protein L596_010965 [Steinernema carpocapsae]|uniref:Uncharacterized protein n=1 Tax=Steinernema carpocapsae TaxID=34508 RepID=A0A4U5NRM5_STECR|nr:hypothetical protein L596_010965 [Steinernema carpocapsae]
MNPQAPRCKQPGQQFEMRSGRVVNCLHEMCSPQFTCEHQLGTEMSICCRNTAFVQRIVTASAPFFHNIKGSAGITILVWTVYFL